MPEVYLCTTHAATFTRYPQQPSRYGPDAYVVFCGWLDRKGIVHTPCQLALLQLSPCCIRNAPWLAFSVKALPSLDAAQKGLGLTWQELAAAPLRNSRRLTVFEKSITCKFLIHHGFYASRTPLTPVPGWPRSLAAGRGIGSCSRISIRPCLLSCAG